MKKNKGGKKKYERTNAFLFLTLPPYTLKCGKTDIFL